MESLYTHFNFNNVFKDEYLHLPSADVYQIAELSLIQTGEIATAFTLIFTLYSMYFSPTTDYMLTKISRIDIMNSGEDNEGSFY